MQPYDFYLRNGKNNERNHPYSADSAKTLHGNQYSRNTHNARNAQRDNYSNKRIKNNRKKKFALFNLGMGLDMPFCILILVLLGIGIVMMFSASYANAYYIMGDSYYYLKRQAIFLVIGLIVMLVVSFLDYHWFHKFTWIILGASYFALVIVLLLPSDGGVKRWLGFGGLGIQASEITKFAVILFLAHWGSTYYNKMQTFKYGIFPALVVFATTALLLYFEPHYSCIVIIAMLTAVMLFVSGIKLRWFAVVGSIIAVLVLVLWATGGLTYAISRLDGWGQALVYTTPDMWQNTWQTRNSLYAIGSGGLFGLGLGQSRQKYLYLPEPQNDFVFAIVCEELGLVGAVIILLIFALLVWRGIVLSLRAKDRFGKLLGIGLTSQIGLQVIINILVITDWLPNTGISLPFFSYGGSSLVMLMLQMGLVLSISRSSNIEKV